MENLKTQNLTESKSENVTLLDEKKTIVFNDYERKEMAVLKVIKFFKKLKACKNDLRRFYIQIKTEQLNYYLDKLRKDNLSVTSNMANFANGLNNFNHLSNNFDKWLEEVERDYTYKMYESNVIDMINKTFV